LSVGPIRGGRAMYRSRNMEDNVSESLLTLRCTFGLHCGLVLVVTRMASVLLGLLA
jgi:hypothetical protein